MTTLLTCKLYPPASSKCLIVNLADRVSLIAAGWTTEPKDAKAAAPVAPDAPVAPAPQPPADLKYDGGAKAKGKDAKDTKPAPKADAIGTADTDD